MRWPILLIMLTTPTAIACASTPLSAPEADERAAAALAFQRDYDRALQADEASFLTAVAAYYFGAGERLELEIAGSALRLFAAPAEPDQPASLQVSVDATREQVVVEAELLALDPAGRWRLGISRQADDWRVLVHDRDAEARRSFTGIAWFPIDAGLIVDARFEPAPRREPKSLQTSRGVTKTLYLAGVYQFEFEGRPQTLEAFGYGPEPYAAEPLLVPFRDQTTGTSSYGAGRYLEPALPDPSPALAPLDFNRATNPLCAYSEHYNCPMPPAFNHLDFAVEAGARAPQDEHG